MRTESDTAPPVAKGQSPIASDVLRGARAIADFTGLPLRRVQSLLEQGQLPAGKLGAQWLASKTRLAAAYDKMTAGADLTHPQS